MTTTTLPIFPLGSVLIPNMPLALQIFEPRYRMMLEHIEADEQRFGVVLIERGFEVGGGDARFTLGTVAELELTRQMSGGQIRLIARGTQRFEVESWLPDDPYPQAEVRLLPELEWFDADQPRIDEVEATVRRALAIASEYNTHAWPSDTPLSRGRLAAAWQLAGIAPVGALDQQTLLGSTSVAELLDGIERLTTEAIELLPLQLPDEPDPA
ncbi:LON peptidase substrate-binding domain-containing protein [Enemella sp. A6]|uniref:LON peptidase substrate-binding domain-containing protein n=1 Tax=Enemella sp. A6 TaxID=3440152 RepID=UPI003EC08AA5